MSQTVQSVRTPMHPLVVLAVAVVLPGVGQVLNGSPSRGLMMLFFMLMLGVITYNLAAPGISLVGQFAGGLFVYAVSVMDAYFWARYRAELHRTAA
jgi:hypothetical protein